MTAIQVFLEPETSQLEIDGIPSLRLPDAVVGGIKSLPEPGTLDEFQGRYIRVARVKLDLGGEVDRAILFVSDPATSQPDDAPQIAIPSTGDAKQDQTLLNQALVQDYRMSLNGCPNGCGELMITTPYDRDCPVCQFHARSNVPHGFTSQA